MIRCIGYLRSLKQLLSILLISCFIFGLGSSVNATFQTVGLVKQNSSINNNYSLGFLRGGGILTDYLGTTKGIIALDSDKLFWWYPDGRPYFYSPSWQGFFTYYDSCPEITYSGSNFVFNQYNCTREIITGDFKSVFSNFFKKVKDDDFVYYTYSDSSVGNTCTVRNKSTIFCWSSKEIGRSMCFDYANCYNGCSVGNYYCGAGIQNGGGFTGSLNYNSLTFGIIPYSDIGQAPGTAGYGGDSSNTGNIQSPDGVELDSIQGALDYYENYYGWNSDICYIGVDSMSVLWGASGVSFNQGGGLNIFEGFNQLYGSSDPDKVYVWINSWLINYRNWFNRSDINEPPLYLVNYNYNNNSVDIYYDNLNFPFTNNPLGVYFMSDFIDYKGTLCDSSCGSDVVSYCNIKLNGGTFEDIIDNSSKESINQYVSQKNIHNGLNGDGTEKTSPFSYSSTGTDYTGAVDFINYYISKFNGLINTDYDGPGFIPFYIIGFMLLLIFFRFISH